MASETQQEKAMAYIAEGRIKAVWVDATSASFNCTGSDVYRTAFVPGVGWECSCPARKTECVHVYAAKLVTDLHLDRAHAKLTGGDDELDELLGS